MCGIAGKLNVDAARAVDPRLVQRMTDEIAHRGPDGEGHYVVGPVGLGHRRLSIIDLDTGAQPLANEDGTVWITFNGEIYNYRELRRDLAGRGHRFRTATDTEVIVHLWEEYGVECLRHLRGMFAFAIWDAKTRSLFLARDRVGIKPLYFCRTPATLVFASEIKALLVDADVPRTISTEAIDCFLTYSYLPGSHTLFEHVRKLEPGHYLLATPSGVVCRQYWDLHYEPDPQWDRLDTAAEALGALLRDTVRDHLISDVPVGFLASGGVDSTALLSYAAELTDAPIQTFTVGFSDPGVDDERPYARLAAERFGTRHHEITLSAAEFRDRLPHYVWHMEEPVCEPPAIALYQVSALARQHVAVLLSGEGGDEAFGGYPEYRNYPALERLKTMAGPLRPAVGAALGAAARVMGDGRLAKYETLLDRPLADYYFSRAATPYDYFNRHRRTLYTDRFAGLVNGGHATDITRALFDGAERRGALNQMLYVDMKTWLPDDLLVKADKMTMATSIELRVPFLDHLVLEFAATLPPRFKVAGRRTKRVLRETFKHRVPAAILTRKKAGFPVPYQRWLAGELHEFVHDMLLSRAALSRGYFSRGGVERVLQSGGRASAAREVFALLVLELWHQRFVDGPAAVASAGALPALQLP